MAKSKKKEKVSEVVEKESSKKQMKHENKIFINILIILGILLVAFFMFYNAINSISSFEVEGIKFQMVTEGDLLLYKTSIPGKIENDTFVIGNFETGEKADYNFYFRKDPRELIKNIDFEGGIVLNKYMVLNMTEGLANVSKCEGDSSIAIGNLAQLYVNAIGATMMTDENATCDDVYGRYTFLRIEEGNETEIAEYGLSGGCYKIKVKDCEILEGTERFMLETLIYINEQLNQ